MARTRNERLHTERREAILAAAARVFKRKGFGGARTEDICAEAGLSAGTVFRHFASKREIVTAVTTREYDSYRALVDWLSSHDGLRALCEMDADGLEELLTCSEFDLGMDSWHELLRDPLLREEMLAAENGLRAQLAVRLKEAQKAGWVDGDVDCVGTASLMCALFAGLLVDREMGVSVDVKATAAAIARLFRGILHTG